MQHEHTVGLLLMAAGMVLCQQRAQAQVVAPAQPCSDSDLIDKLGGVSAVAELLSLGKRGRARVCNWRQRGIPARVKLAHPQVFLQQPAAQAAPVAAATTEEVRDGA